MIKRTTGVSTTDITGRLLKLLEPESPLVKIDSVGSVGSLSRINMADPPK